VTAQTNFLFDKFIDPGSDMDYGASVRFHAKD